MKFREQQQLELMHRLDPQLQSLDKQLELSSAVEVGVSHKEVEGKIRAREELLAPVYMQLACEFADLHDRVGRMEAQGVIRKGLEWRSSRAFFYWRIRRRLAEQALVRRLRAADPGLSVRAAQELLTSWLPPGAEDDLLATAFLGAPELEASVEGVRVAAVRRMLRELEAKLPEAERGLRS